MILVKILNMMDIKEALLQWFKGGDIKNENILNKELAEQLHKSIIKKFKTKKYTHLL